MGGADSDGTFSAPSGTLNSATIPSAIRSGWIAAIFTPFSVIVLDGHTFTHSGSPPHRSQNSGALVVGWNTVTSPGHWSRHSVHTLFCAVRVHRVVSTLIVFSFLLVSTTSASTGHASTHLASAPHW